jgi:hypothetical protein
MMIQNVHLWKKRIGMSHFFEYVISHSRRYSIIFGKRAIMNMGVENILSESSSFTLGKRAYSDDNTIHKQPIIHYPLSVQQLYSKIFKYVTCSPDLYVKNKIKDSSHKVCIACNKSFSLGKKEFVLKQFQCCKMLTHIECDHTCKCIELVEEEEVAVVIKQQHKRQKKVDNIKVDISTYLVDFFLYEKTYYHPSELYYKQIIHYQL